MSDLYGRFSPIPKYGLPDYKRDSGAWADWIEEQNHYFLNGFTAGGDTITGRLYFKLNFTKMLITDSNGNKRPASPYYADAVRELYDLIDRCQKNERNLVTLKGRDKGFTYDLAAISLFETQLVDYSTVLGLFPGGNSPAKKNFKKAYDLSWNNLLPDFQHHPDLTDSKDLLYYGWKEKDSETGHESIEGIQSSLTMLEAVSPDVSKSGRYKFVLIDELGEIKDGLKLIVTSDANMREGAKKFGMIIAGGTSNAFNDHGYKQFRELWYNNDAYGFEKLFIPANKSYWGFVNYLTGESDLEGAKAHRMEIRKKKKGEELMIEMQNYPFEEAEAFISTRKSPYNSMLASKRITEILGDSTIEKYIQRGNLYAKKNDKGEIKVEFHPDPNGRWRIFKGPATGLMHPDVGGVDSYRFNDVDNAESKGAIVIYRPYQGPNKLGALPICIYHYRHKNKEDFFEDCLLTAIYYNCKMLIEKSDEDIFTFFKQRMSFKYLKEQPKLIQSTWAATNTRYGVPPSVQNANVAVEYSANEFEKNSENYVFVELLDELIKFNAENTDIADAFKWAVMHAYDNLQVLPEYKKEKVQKFRPYTMSDGRGGLIVINSPELQNLHGNRN